VAWKAVITGASLDGPSITVGYYDDADPQNTPAPSVFLYSQTFSRGEITSDADLRQQVIATGKQIRTAYQRIQALKATGAITIP
jgi:hypothetical protein